MGYAAVMRYTPRLVHLSLLVFGAGCAGTQSTPTCPDSGAAEVRFPSGQEQIAAHADEIAWVSCPPTLPTPCEMAVLEGDPKSKMLFTVRFRVEGAFEMKPHWHPRNERVTVLEGRIGVGFGDEIAREGVTWFGPGDYYVNARNAHHFVLADGPSVLQITGLGPWKANFLE